MVKRVLMSLILIMGIITVYSQNVERLESEPTFKGITIGMPINSIANKLSFDSVVNGDTMVWCIGMSNWKKLQEVVELSRLINITTPPPLNL